MSEIKVAEAIHVLCVARGASFFEIGKKYLIRMATNYAVGEVQAVNEQEILLKDASWVAWTKRWEHTLRTGELDEVEPHLGICIVGRGAIVDAAVWNHDLPTEPK